MEDLREQCRRCNTRLGAISPHHACLGDVVFRDGAWKCSTCTMTNNPWNIACFVSGCRGTRDGQVAGTDFGPLSEAVKNARHSDAARAARIPAWTDAGGKGAKGSRGGYGGGYGAGGGRGRGRGRGL